VRGQLQGEIVFFEAVGRGWREDWHETQGFCRRRNTRMMGCWVAGSCGVLVERRGAKQELSRGEPCDDMHGSASSTLDAPPPDSLPSMPPSISQARQTWRAPNREVQLLTNIYFPLLNLYDLRVRNGYLYLKEQFDQEQFDQSWTTRAQGVHQNGSGLGRSLTRWSC
jgi:hypothetical protein